jgi:hypothetical protein
LGVKRSLLSESPAQPTNLKFAARASNAVPGIITGNTQARISHQ